jgi:hypothetical protein
LVKVHNFRKIVTNLLLNHTVIENHLFLYWESVMNNLQDDQFVLISFRILYSTGKWATLGPLQKVNKKDQNVLCEILCSFLDVKAEEYRNTPILEINFNYLIIPSDKDKNKKSKIVQHIKKTKISSFNLWGYDLPNTADFYMWGEILIKTPKIITISRPNSSLNYKIELFDHYNEITLINSNQTVFTFIDKFSDKNNLNTFTRIIKNQEYVFY